MGDCASSQSAIQPILTPNQPQAPKNQQPVFKSPQKHQCSQQNIYNNNNPQLPPEHPPPSQNNFSMMVLNTILTQFVDLDRDEKQAIFQNIQQLIFTPVQYFGGIKIENKDTCVSVLEKDNVDLMVTSGFGIGRVFAVAHQCIFKDFLVKDKDWIIFLRNIIKWLTKNKQSSKQKPLKILLTTITQKSKIIHALARASLFVQIYYEQKITGTNLSDYDCIFMYDLIQKYFTNDDCTKINEYVRGGGGLLIALRGWSYKNSTQGKNLKNWVTDSCYNKILSPMGLSFSEDYPALESINFKPKQIIKLAEPQIKTYTKQLNPLFVQQLDQKLYAQLSEVKKKLLEGVGDLDFGSDIFSSFNFRSNSYIGIFKQYISDICAAGNYGKGKVFAFGHWDIFSCSNTQYKQLQKFVQNILKWMIGDKKNIQVGLLYPEGSWECFKWKTLTLGTNISSKIIQKAQDFQNLDIICVGYYQSYPKTLNQDVMNKLKEYVKNGGNIFFGSHGWEWQINGEYKDNKSLIYEKNFASYTILKNFGITLDQNKLAPQKPYNITNNKHDPSIKKFLKDDLLKVLKDPKLTKFSASQFDYRRINIKIAGIKPREFLQICSVDLYHQLVDAFIQSRFNIQTNQQTVSAKELLDCFVYGFMSDLSYACPPHICRALPPSLNKFPGCATSRLKEKTVEVYRNLNRIVFTGLYLNPGQVVKVKHNNSFSELKNVQLKVNLNQQLYYHCYGKPKRFPTLTHTYDLSENQFLIASPHGGMIYFQVILKSQQKNPLVFTFEGAYQMPYWNENIHSFADFQKIKKINAPMFVIETKRINLVGPTFGIFPQLNIKIERLSKYWNKVIGIYKDYSSTEQYPFYKDTILSDISLTKGSMHSGYPMMINDEFTFQMLGIGEKLYTNATWGFYHQLGHNYQNTKWDVIQLAEVSCNIFSLYLNYKMHNITIAQILWQERKLQEVVKKHFQKQSRAITDFVGDNFLGLTFFAILMEQLGYEIFGQLNKAYMKVNLTKNTYEGIFDTLVEQISIVAHQNIWYYFKKWGMPVTPESLAKVNHLQTFKCKKFPFITNQ